MRWDVRRATSMASRVLRPHSNWTQTASGHSRLPQTTLISVSVAALRRFQLASLCNFVTVPGRSLIFNLLPFSFFILLPHLNVASQSRERWEG